SAPRGSKEKRAIVDAHRSALHQRYIVFDPLSIDEKVLAMALTDQYPDWYKHGSASLYGRILTLPAELRWPTEMGPDLVPLRTDWPTRFPITLDAGEVVEVCRPT